VDIAGALRPVIGFFVIGQFLVVEFLGQFGAFIDPFRARRASGAVVLAAGIFTGPNPQLGTFVVFW
jgi:hypothetical protein